MNFQSVTFHFYYTRSMNDTLQVTSTIFGQFLALTTDEMLDSGKNMTRVIV